jgi:hypothetical protein
MLVLNTFDFRDFAVPTLPVRNMIVLRHHVRSMYLSANICKPIADFHEACYKYHGSRDHPNLYFLYAIVFLTWLCCAIEIYETLP